MLKNAILVAGSLALLSQNIPASGASTDWIGLGSDGRDTWFVFATVNALPDGRIEAFPLSSPPEGLLNFRSLLGSWIIDCAKEEVLIDAQEFYEEAFADGKLIEHDEEDHWINEQGLPGEQNSEYANANGIRKPAPGSMGRAIFDRACGAKPVPNKSWPFIASMHWKPLGGLDGVPDEDGMTWYISDTNRSKLNGGGQLIYVLTNFPPRLPGKPSVFLDGNFDTAQESRSALVKMAISCEDTAFAIQSDIYFPFAFAQGAPIVSFDNGQGNTLDEAQPNTLIRQIVDQACH